MTFKEIVDGHLKKSSAHHDALAKCNRKLAECHKAASDAHSEPSVAAAHRDLSKCHGDIAKAHEARQEDFENLRERLVEASDADVLDSHEDETRNMQSVRSAAGHDTFLKRIGVLQD